MDHTFLLLASHIRNQICRLPLLCSGELQCFEVISASLAVTSLHSEILNKRSVLAIICVLFFYYLVGELMRDYPRR